MSRLTLAVHLHGRSWASTRADSEERYLHARVYIYAGVGVVRVRVRNNVYAIAAGKNQHIFHWALTQKRKKKVEVEKSFL